MLASTQHSSKPHLRTCYLRYGYRVHYVRLARQAAHSLVGLFREIERLCYQVYLLAVACGKIAVKQMLERVVHQFVFRLGLSLVYAVLLFHGCVLLGYYINKVYLLTVQKITSP